MITANVSTKEAVLRVLDELPQERINEVLEFALFIRARSHGLKPDLTVPAVPVLEPLVGLVAWGGDAVVDAERLYE